MRITRLILPALIFFASIFSNADAQSHPPFWSEIQGFKKLDSTAFPGKNKIVFTGSSSFRKWTTLQEAFPSFPLINRGFGGSNFLDMIRYVDDIVTPYDPKQVLIYCGDNDLASSDTVTPAVVLDRFKKFFSLVRNRYPRLPIAFVSIKPSPSRRRLMPKMVEANAKIKKFLKKKSRTSYIDVYSKMLNEDGTVVTDIWESDSLHMTAKGYAIWQKVIEPYLKK